MVIECIGQRILLVEESATLRYILVKGLQRQGYDLLAVEQFDSAITTLSQSADEFHAVIIGWPNYAVHKEADSLLSMLEDEELVDIPVLLVTHDAEIDVLNWMSHRRRSALVPWENYQEAIVTLHRLLGPNDIVESNHPVKQQENPIRILFVDDSVSIRHYYQRLLNRNGYITETADSVDSAFEMALKYSFDLAIVDYFMPEQNGYVLCQKLLDDKRTCHIRTAVITGTYLDEVIKDCLQAGAVECMFKNEAEELFLARIASMSHFIQVQKHVEAEKERLSGILESVGEGVYGVNNDGVVTFVNPAALNIIGSKNTENIIGERARHIFHYHTGDDSIKHDRLYRAYGKGIELRCWETAFKHDTGKPVPVECTVYPLHIHGLQQGSVVAFRDISERKMLEEKLHWQATHDHLTRLFNRRYFEERVSMELQSVKKGERMSALLYLDLDQFKYVNDTAGHDTGDRLLIEIAHLLSDHLRENDLLARLGGDEFAIIIINVDEKTAIEVTETYRQVLASCHFNYANDKHNVQGSFGVALMDEPDMTSGDILANADIACHIAKRSGRNQTHLYTKDSDEKNAMGSELGWSQRLRTAMGNDGFELHYQPILDLSKINVSDMPANNGEIWSAYASDVNNPLHYECLLRMHGDSGELYYPDAFIPTAERFNLMCNVDLWVLNKALQALNEIHQQRKNITLSINLSGHTINAKDSLEYIERLLDIYGTSPKSIILEVTETAAIANFDAASHFIDEMKHLGFRFSLDDFGSGFCSFSQLKCLPADYVKIDGSFVKSMARGAIDRAIVTAMNDVAHSLGRYTVAEYVESPEVLRLLKICGVDYVQGHYVSEPLTQLGS